MVLLTVCIGAAGVSGYVAGQQSVQPLDAPSFHLSDKLFTDSASLKAPPRIPSWISVLCNNDSFNLGGDTPEQTLTPAMFEAMCK